MGADEHELLTVPEAAMELRLSSPTVRRLIGEGVIPVVQLAPGHAVRIRRDDLDRLIEAHSKERRVTEESPKSRLIGAGYQLWAGDFTMRSWTTPDSRVLTMDEALAELDQADDETEAA